MEQQILESQSIYDIIKKVISKTNIQYTQGADTGHIIAGMDLGSKDAPGPRGMLLLLYDERTQIVQMRFVSATKCQKSNLVSLITKMVEFNYVLKIGQWYCDQEDGEFGFVTGIDLEDIEDDMDIEHMIEKHFLLTLTTVFQEFGNIAKIAAGEAGEPVIADKAAASVQPTAVAQ